MANNDLAAFKDLYVSTALENIASFEEAINRLVNNEKDVLALEQAHRNIHTLKSKSILMGFQSTGAMSKAIEDRLNAAIRGVKSLTHQEAQVFNGIGKKLHESINGIKTNDKELDFSQEISGFAE